MSKLHIYKASAGSGKTFLLTQKWLILAFTDVENYSKILAVTFTNKAAEEMKSRILEEISAIIHKKEKSGHYNTLKSTLGLTDVQMLNRANQLRDNILHNYSLFSVNTIDSFVQRIVRAFSFEIGVNSNYEIELDTQKVLSDLTDLLYQRMSEDVDLQKHLISFAKFKIDDGKSWDFKKDIGELAKELFKEQFQSQNLDEKINDKSTLETFTNEVKTVKAGLESEMKAIHLEAKKTLSEHNIQNIKNLGTKFSTLVGFLLTTIVSKKIDINATVQKSIETDISAWYKKNEDKEIVSQIEAVYPKLSELIRRAVEAYDTQYQRYMTAKLVLENLYAFGILTDMAELLPEYRAENNVLLISDTTLLLKEIIGNNDAPFIYEKAGSRFKHVLIDEFQDTSGFQWANFRPLIENSLAEARFNLIVGDIKQSIYRWRGGDWKLLLNQVKAEIGTLKSEEHSLDTNWRSKRNVLDFNNALFAAASQILQTKYNIQIEESGTPEVVQALKDDGFYTTLTDAYFGNFQLSPNKPQSAGGRTLLRFLEKGDEDFESRISVVFPEDIDAILREKKYEPRDITVLVRTNRQAKVVMQMLSSYQDLVEGAEKYTVVSSESLQVTNSEAVRILAAAIKYLDNPTDYLNTAILLKEYVLRQNIPSHTLDEIFHIATHPDIHDTILPEDFLLKTDELKRHSLYELTEQLISVFDLTKNEKDFPFLQAFQDAISDYTRNKNSSLSAFSEWWSEKGSSLSVQLPDSLNAVKVMTVHKSKGLAFPVTIVPFADWNLDASAQNSPLIWSQTQNEPFDTFDFLPIRYKSDMGKSDFRREYFDEKLYLYMDALNVLYVAFTRAEDILIAYCLKSKSPDKLNQIGDVLYTAVTNGIHPTDSEGHEIISLKSYFDSENQIFDLSENYAISEDKTDRKTETQTVKKLTEYPNFDYKNRISINFSSDDFFIESSDYVADRVNYGTLMHKIFSEIETAADIERAVYELSCAGYIKSAECDALTEQIREIISRENVAAWFNGSMQVITEKAITTETGELRIPDRVLFDNKKAIIIDFKFGEPHAEHETQIKEYQYLIEKLYKLPTISFLYYAGLDMLKKIE